MLLFDNFLKTNLDNSLYFYSVGFMGKDVNESDKKNYFWTLWEYSIYPSTEYLS